ncbi:MAG: rhodanese-like domain-containing protein [Acidobacteriota bacterium]|nr:MAG: rhodanese-like domain-containing protein [Acidobacteriota bacterium]
MIRPISPEELDRLVQDGLKDPEVPTGCVRIYDVRETIDAFRAGHVPGARHVPVEQVMRWIPQKAYPHELVVLIDGDGRVGGSARRVAAKLAHAWFRRLRFLTGGMKQWLADGLAIETGGAAGRAGASAEGELLESLTSKAVPWTVSSKPLPPDPSRELPIGGLRRAKAGSESADSRKGPSG